MYEIDLLPIEKTGEQGSRSGDAIAVRFTEKLTGRTRHIVIDGGFTHTGEQLVDHIRRWYDTDYIDLVISTHPDQDHLNGLVEVLQAFEVGELLIHNPHNHHRDSADVSNIAVVDALIVLAEEKGITLTEPFQGLSYFGDQIQILGPTQAYYKELLEEQLSEPDASNRSLTAALRAALSKAEDLLARVLPSLPVETLAEDGETSPRNNSSVNTLLTTDVDKRILFTGDSGIPALQQAWDVYEAALGPHSEYPLDVFQVPHHGSKHNLSPSLLNRIFGQPGESPLAPLAVISSAKADPKHPSPKVSNALQRRGLNVAATEGKALLAASPMPARDGYGPITPIPPLSEDDD